MPLPEQHLAYHRSAGGRIPRGQYARQVARLIVQPVVQGQPGRYKRKVPHRVSDRQLADEAGQVLLHGVHEHEPLGFDELVGLPVAVGLYQMVEPLVDIGPVAGVSVRRRAVPSPPILLAGVSDQLIPHVLPHHEIPFPAYAHQGDLAVELAAHHRLPEDADEAQHVVMLGYQSLEVVTG